MRSWARLPALAAGLVLVAFALMALKALLPGDAAPPAEMRAAPTAPSRDEQTVVRQPTILQAKPAVSDPRMTPADGSRYGHWPSEDLPQYSGDELTSPFSGQTSPNPRLLDHAVKLEGFQAELQPAAPLGPEAWPQEAPSEGRLDPPAVPPPAVSQRPDRSSPRVYLTEADDSLWTISEEVYGVGDYYLALYFHNRAKITAPDRLQSGLLIDTPSADELRRLYPEYCPAE